MLYVLAPNLVAWSLGRMETNTLRGWRAYSPSSSDMSTMPPACMRSASTRSTHHWHDGFGWPSPTFTCNTGAWQLDALSYDTSTSISGIIPGSIYRYSIYYDIADHRCPLEGWERISGIHRSSPSQTTTAKGARHHTGTPRAGAGKDTHPRSRSDT
jgi:hypothetical protein